MGLPSNTSDKKGCGNPTTTECVIWQGENIPCLGIERGQTISTVVETIAKEFCLFKKEFNLDSLDLKCIVDYCLICPQPEKTLTNILQLLINKVCDIQDIINDINSTTTTDANIIRLASCFQYVTPSGDLVVDLPHEEYTRLIASKVCSLSSSITSIQNSIDDLDNQINGSGEIRDRVTALENATGDQVSSDCLFNGTKSIEDAWDLLDQAFCQTRKNVGISTDVNLAISQQCEGLNAEFASNPAWILNPSNIAQSLNNLWIVMCARSGAIKAIQDNCCSVNCDDIKIGFVVAFEDGFEVVKIRFTNGSGTNIPNGFTDFGSVLTVSDESGNTLSFNITIENNGEEVINLLGLNGNDKLTFSIEAKLSNGDLRCEKCIGKTIDSSFACAYCTITNIGSGDALIIYEIQTQG